MKLRSRIDLNLLAVFDAVFRRASVTEAARHLNLSQSAVSHALARLRRELDDPLFVRSGNTMVPTALARLIGEPVQGALRGIELAVLAAGRFEPATTQRAFRIGLRPTIEAQLFPRLALRALAQAPDVALTSVDFRRSDLAGALAGGDLDLALDVPSERTASLRSRVLRRDRLIVIARRGHPRIDGTLDLATYLAMGHVMASPRPAGLGIEDEALAAIGAERRIAIRCQHIDAACQVVAGSDLVLTTSQAQGEVVRRAADLQVLPLPIDVPPRALQLLWHEAAERDPGNAWLRGVIEEVAAAT